MPPAKRLEPQKTKPSPSFQKEDFAKQHPSKMGVPKQAESPQRGKVTGSSQNEAGGEILPEQPSTTITAPTRSAWEDVNKARTEYEKITTTYSRLRTIYNISPYNGYSIFAGILNSSLAQEIFDMIRGAHDSITRMAQIASGDTEAEESLRMEYATILENHRKPAPEETVAKETEGQESPGTETAEEAPAYDTSELFDYLKKRYFWRTENEIYNTSRSMYVRRNGWVSTIIANRSNFEAEEHEGFWARAAKWAATIGTRDEALKYIDKVQGIYLPQVPHHESGEENRHLLIPDTNSHLDALERSRLPEIQEAYIKVIDNKDAALKTAEVLKDVAEYTKTASEIVISTGATILTGGNPAAEALINGLYSGALSAAGQLSSSSVAEGEYQKAKAQLEASGLDPDSDEYKQAMQALEKKKESAEFSWGKVGMDAAISAGSSIVPFAGKQLGKAAVRSRPGLWVGKVGSAVKGKIGNLAGRAGEAIKGKAGQWAGKAGKFFGGIGKSLADSPIGQFGRWIGRGAVKSAKWLANSPVGTLAKKTWRGVVKLGKSLGHFGSSVMGSIKSAWRNFQERRAQKAMIRELFESLTGKKTLYTKLFKTQHTLLGGFGRSLGRHTRNAYHRVFDRFSEEAFAKRSLLRQMEKIDPSFNPSLIDNPEVERLLATAAKETAGLPAAIRRERMRDAYRDAMRIHGKDIVKQFDSDQVAKLATDADQEVFEMIAAARNLDDLPEAEQKKRMLEAYEAFMKKNNEGSSHPLSEVTEEMQEDLMRATHETADLIGKDREKAIFHSAFLHNEARSNPQIDSYLSRRRDYLDAVENGAKADAINASTATQNKAFFGKITDTLKEKGTDFIKSDLIGITPVNPLDAGMSVMTDYAKYQAKQWGHSIVPDFIDEPKEFSYIGDYIDQFRNEEGLVYSEIKNRFFPDKDTSEQPENPETDIVPDMNPEENPDHEENPEYEEDPEYDFSTLDLSDLFTDE